MNSHDHAPSLAELESFLRIPSIAADAARAGDVRRAGEWVAEYVEGAGGTAEILDRGALPLVEGRLTASRDADRAPTVLLYGHFDVQPPGPLSSWDSPPFEPTVRDGWLYARGASDDKGQLYMLLRAARLLAEEGALPVNVEFLCDGEEEIFGDTASLSVESRKTLPDACLIFDAFMPTPGAAAFYVGLRGLVYLRVTVRTGSHALHSGIYGGAALNALHALLETLAGVLPPRGETVPPELRRGVIAPDPRETRDWPGLEPGQSVLRAQGAAPLDERAGRDFYKRTWAEPSIDLHSIDAGGGELQHTAIPPAASAMLSVRLAPGQRSKEIADACVSLLRSSCPPGAELAVDVPSACEPALLPPDSEAVRLVLAAFEQTLGRRPLLQRVGGSIPVVSALAARGVPTVVTGFGLRDDNVHGPNERLRLSQLGLGIEAARASLLALGRLGS